MSTARRLHEPRGSVCVCVCVCVCVSVMERLRALQVTSWVLLTSQNRYLPRARSAGSVCYTQIKHTLSYSGGTMYVRIREAERGRFACTCFYLETPSLLLHDQF